MPAPVKVEAAPPEYKVPEVVKLPGEVLDEPSPIARFVLVSEAHAVPDLYWKMARSNPDRAANKAWEELKWLPLDPILETDKKLIAVTIATMSSTSTTAAMSKAPR